MPTLPPRSSALGNGHCFGPRRAAAARDVCSVELAKMLGDVAEMVLDGKMASVEAVHLRVREILQVGVTTFLREEDVALPPEDDRLRLTLPQERLPRRIERNVRAIVIEQIEIQAHGVWPLHECDIRLPAVRADQFRTLRAVQIDRLDRISGQESKQWLLGCVGSLLPQRVAETVPCGSESDLIRIGV